MTSPTLPFAGFNVVHHGKGKNATISVHCAACDDQVVVADAASETRAIELAEENRLRRSCCTCSIVAIIAAALDDGHGTPDDDLDAAKAVVASLVDHGWRFRTDNGGTVHPRIRRP
jgi:hypothetical protein